jgi:hypothetical protein
LEHPAVAPLEQLFLFEIEFHRRLRAEANEPADSGGLHTSYALQAGYEPLLRAAGPVTAADVEALARKLALAGDPRDVLRARDSVMTLLGIRMFQG